MSVQTGPSRKAQSWTDLRVRLISAVVLGCVVLVLAFHRWRDIPAPVLRGRHRGVRRVVAHDAGQAGRAAVQAGSPLAFVCAFCLPPRSQCRGVADRRRRRSVHRLRRSRRTSRRLGPRRPGLCQPCRLCAGDAARGRRGGPRGPRACHLRRVVDRYLRLLHRQGAGRPEDHAVGFSEEDSFRIPRRA